MNWWMFSIGGAGMFYCALTYHVHRKTSFGKVADCAICLISYALVMAAVPR